jgi:hypothetical protein
MSPAPKHESHEGNFEERIAGLEIALEAVTADHRRIWGLLGMQREVNDTLLAALKAVLVVLK